MIVDDELKKNIYEKTRAKYRQARRQRRIECRNVSFGVLFVVTSLLVAVVNWNADSSSLTRTRREDTDTQIIWQDKGSLIRNRIQNIDVYQSQAGIFFFFLSRTYNILFCFYVFRP